MRLTVALLQRRAASTSAATAVTAPHHKASFKKSLALSVYFKQPDLGMREYEILSRATAFLLGVDAPDHVSDSNYGFLEKQQQRRDRRQYQHKHGVSPASGAGRKMMDLGWLEFVPREVRPQTHVVASSHVLSPFLWKDYYPQDWLSQVRQEHCKYALEVYDDAPSPSSNQPSKPLAKLALNPEPFHHPEGRDIGLIHLADESESLNTLAQIGVNILHLRNPDKLYEKGEDLVFDGYVVADGSDARAPMPTPSIITDENVDNRVFRPYQEVGKLSYHTDDRFFAWTPAPLPEGLCGAPALDADNNVCGMVEGIVPVGHKDARLAGNAAFMPSYLVASFVDYVERGLTKSIMPADLFELVVNAKKTNSIGGGVFKADGDGRYTTESNWHEAYDLAMRQLSRKYPPQEREAILKTIEHERDEVLRIFNEEGGDMDDIMQRVRLQTLAMREMVHDQYRKRQQEAESSRDGEYKS